MRNTGDRIAVQGARLSYRQNCESMQRIHVSPVLGGRRVDGATSHDVELLARALLKRGLAPRIVRPATGSSRCSRCGLEARAAGAAQSDIVALRA